MTQNGVRHDMKGGHNGCFIAFTKKSNGVENLNLIPIKGGL